MFTKSISQRGKMNKKTKTLSKTSKMHYTKLIIRSLLLIAAVIFYIIHRFTNAGNSFYSYTELPWILGIIWIVYAIEMLLRFFPSSIESPGCQKQFSKNYRPTGEKIPRLISWKRVFYVVITWLVLNAVIGILYYTKIIDSGILILISFTYGVCDMICILFFCPFQTWIMKNRCCCDCRIYNWDFAMMFTPYIFIPSVYTWSLLLMSLFLLLRWEITVRIHPERFSETTNSCISCKNCSEKLCSHKKQLRGFINNNKERLRLKGNEIIETAKESIDKTLKTHKNNHK